MPRVRAGASPSRARAGAARVSPRIEQQRAELGLGTAAIVDDTEFAAADHVHNAVSIPLDDSGWTKLLLDQGITNVQELADWIDSTLTDKLSPL